jgi:hypothetical protein
VFSFVSALGQSSFHRGQASIRVRQLHRRLCQVGTLGEEYDEHISICEKIHYKLYLSGRYVAAVLAMTGGEKHPQPRRMFLPKTSSARGPVALSGQDRQATLSACESFDLCSFCIQIQSEEAPHRPVPVAAHDQHCDVCWECRAEPRRPGPLGYTGLQSAAPPSHDTSPLYLENPLPSLKN